MMEHVKLYEFDKADGVELCKRLVLQLNRDIELMPDMSPPL